MSSLGPDSRYLSARQSNRNSDNDQSRDDGTNWYPEEPTDLGNCLGSMGRRGRQDRVVAAEGSTCSSQPRSIATHSRCPSNVSSSSDSDRVAASWQPRSVRLWAQRSDEDVASELADSHTASTTIG
jgi:hypothetical protein